MSIRKHYFIHTVDICLLRTKLHVPSSYGSFAVTITLNAKHKFNAASILLVCILQGDQKVSVHLMIVL
jgi:hypothetical protein